MTEERYEFTSTARKRLVITLIVGLVVFALGTFMISSGGHDAHGADAAGAEGGHHAFNWMQRIWANLWINNVFFAGLSIIGVFFVAIQYAAQAGWSAGIKRIPLAFGGWLPIAFVLMLVVYFFGGHDIFHWTHHDLYDPASPNFDAIINGKKGFFYWPLSEHPSVPVFWIARLVVFFGVWYFIFTKIRSLMFQEDQIGGDTNWYKLRSLSAVFLVFFAFSSSIAAWDWVMSIDTHWFSTMMGWYVFASWWVSGLALITFIVVLLKDKGYLKIVNANHLHDLGKFVFAFSVFWTYIWFSQFFLIYYSNIPEESIYFVERWKDNHYAPVFYFNLAINFFFPFLVLMTRDSKRHSRILKVVCPAVIFGHWIDFYLMVTPGTLKENGGFGLVEVGMFTVFVAAFIYVVLSNLSKAPLVGKNHPMLEESLHHHI